MTSRLFAKLGIAPEDRILIIAKDLASTAQGINQRMRTDDHPVFTSRIGQPNVPLALHVSTPLNKFHCEINTRTRPILSRGKSAGSKVYPESLSRATESSQVDIVVQKDSQVYG